MIPFSPPRIDDKICNEVVAALKSGWITTGPRTKLFEKQISEYCGCERTVCLNSATAGLELALRWFGVQEGDEVILPAYTYSATANVIVHCGAKPVFVDVNKEDFNISVAAIEKALTPRTKAIMPVDFAGFPCDYDEINKMVRDNKALFVPRNEIQKKLGRCLVLSDSAHSFGARYHGKPIGTYADFSVFSFHAVKNLPTAEGGAVAINLPHDFDAEEVYQVFCVKSLHGQNKDALAKSKAGNWRYDIVEAGYKCNMTDIAAAIGIVELERYDKDTLQRRKHIATLYHKLLHHDQRLTLPVFKNSTKESSYHIYPLRINGATEQMRDEIMQQIMKREVSVNVHFIPVPAMTFYRKMGYNPDDYPVAKANSNCEITLPLYYDLNDDLVKTVSEAVLASVNEIL